MIKIIVDSTCDLDQAIIDQYQIDVIPLQVLINAKSYKDKFELDIHTLYKHIEQKDDIKTSLPSYEDMGPLFEGYAKNGVPFIFFSFASALSGTFNFAHLIIQDLKAHYPTQMHAIDLKNGGLASALIMEKIISYISTEASFESVISYSEHLIDHMKHVMMLEDLSQLRKGGRISAVQSIISNALAIKPVLQLVQGEIKPYKRAIGTKRALNELLKYVNLYAKDLNTQIGILYSANEVLLQQMLDLLTKKGYQNIKVGRIASVMTAHIGLDAVSICFFDSLI